ncbi:MAG: SANT/Myb domain-containing protein, partial [Myxococcales bacterium]|nr:SANT/Myb domain-containing protein [Myxococcales bacterium]
MSSSWRPEEDERLLAAVKQHGDDWTEIALAVAGGRSRKACRNRHRRLTVDDVEDVEDVEDVPNPLAVLQTRRDPVTEAPGGVRVFDMESGREFAEEMDAISQDVRRMFGSESGGSITPEGLHAMVEETLARLSSHGISARIVDSEDTDALLQEQDELLLREGRLLQEELGVKFMVGPPPEA